MGVKKLLAKRAAGFISLHEVLTKMQADGATYQQAAQALYMLMNDRDKKPLAWLTKTALNGVTPASNKEEIDAMSCLMQAAKSGEPKEKNARDEFDDQIPF